MKPNRLSDEWLGSFRNSCLDVLNATLTDMQLIQYTNRFVSDENKVPVELYRKWKVKAKSDDYENLHSVFSTLRELVLESEIDIIRNCIGALLQTESPVRTKQILFILRAKDPARYTDNGTVKLLNEELQRLKESGAIEQKVIVEYTEDAGL